ncbi:SDR family NAD(P)-dependent oxidoreductase [Gordonia sp. CPCC 205333]|uniref:SDR family NAD(P)-dependent oxidoreductase n=1 Tax=Gordonia sp. CPCC 205333 TaxID=3140790 RepID=UPI003AF3A51C
MQGVEPIADLNGQTVIVTGANGGLGAEVARMLGAGGARVVLACRNLVTAKEVAASLDCETVVEELDLSSLESVRDFAARWRDPVDVLVNNAGIMFVPEGTTEDGFERAFGTNHLGHFALTGLLLDKVRRRVVTVSSVAHWRGRAAGLRDPNFEHRPFNRTAAYGNSKLANLVFARELDRRLRTSGSPVRSYAAHPGVVATGLYDHSESTTFGIFGQAARLGGSVSDGAAPITHAAVDPHAKSGAFYGPGLMVRGRRVRSNPSSGLSRNRQVAEQLWVDSEQLTKLRYAF